MISKIPTLMAIGTLLFTSVASATSWIDISQKKKVSYRELADYLKGVSDGVISENPKMGPLLDVYLNPISNLKKEDLVFKVDAKKKIAISLNSVSPHSINELFVVDPKRYMDLNGGKDFLESKINHFNKTKFMDKDFSYQKDFIHLADWHSLDHPPVMELGDDLAVWSKNEKSVNSKSNSLFFDPRFQQKIDQISGNDLSFGNELELLQNGASFKRKLALVENAKESVLIAVMSFYCDNTSALLQDLLLEKVKQGVDVKIMVEKIWTLIAMKKCFFNMKNHGIDFILANDLLKSKSKAALFHNKFMVVDGKVGVIGGSNLIKNDNFSTGFNRLNTDEDVQVKGPLVADLTHAFVELYHEYRSPDQKHQGKSIDFYAKQADDQIKAAQVSNVRGSGNYQKLLSEPSTRLHGVCRFVIQNPRTDRHLLSRVYEAYFQQAEQSIRLQSGPFDETSPMFAAIFDRVDHFGVSLSAVGNGVDAGCAEYTGLLDFKLKEIQNEFRPTEKALLNLLKNWVEKCGAEEHHPPLLAIEAHSNAQAWEHFEYLHTKSFQIDGVVSSVSSFNFDKWSEDKSHESGILCMDEHLNEQVYRSYLRDAVNSTPTVSENGLHQ